MVRHYQIIVIGEKGLLPPSTCQAWDNAGILLIGPVLPSDFHMGLVSGIHGVLIDATCEPQFMFQLSEDLEAAAVPFLFVVSEQNLAVDQVPYVLGAGEEDIGVILHELLHQYDAGVRH